MKFKKGDKVRHFLDASHRRYGEGIVSCEHPYVAGSYLVVWPCYDPNPTNSYRHPQDMLRYVCDPNDILKELLCLK